MQQLIKRRPYGRQTGCPLFPVLIFAFSIALFAVALHRPQASFAAEAVNARNISAAAELSRKYLQAASLSERARLAAQLEAFQGDWEAVVAALRTRSIPDAKIGYLPAEHFSAPPLRGKRTDDLLYFTVPESYRADQPTGLIIYMHGGGKATPRNAPARAMDFPKPGEEANSDLLGDVFAATGMIAVGPSAPWDENSNARWCVEAADDYLADVIAECKHRFNIDEDRVILVGHSMGGFGAYHHAQRQPDRFAAVGVLAGAWSRAFLPMLRGTRLGIVHGINDAVPEKRWHHTDIEHARQTIKMLAAAGIEHRYYEHDRGHALNDSRDGLRQFLADAVSTRRDAYHPQVAVATPIGFSRNSCYPAKHNRWLTLDEAGEGEIDFDELIANGSKDFAEWRLDHRVARRPGAAIEAENLGGNRIRVTRRHVKRFTIWLHPSMVDVDKPVSITIDDQPPVVVDVKPSLAAALESYERRHDWGLIYPIKLSMPR